MILNRRMQLFVGLATVAALASGAEELGAATLEVTATVPDACTVDNGTLAFGTYTSGQVASLQGSGGFNVQCTSATSVNIALDAGMHEGSGSNGRAMASPDTGDFLNYDLYPEGGFTNPWPPGTPISFPVTSGPNDIVVNGLVQGGQSPAGGDYSDTVQITLTFN